MLGSDDRFTQVSPDDPTLWATTASSFGGEADVASGQDNGEFAFGGGSVTPEGDNQEDYAAFPADFFSSGAIKPGDTVLAVNPHTGTKVPVVARDIGPSAKSRGADFAPHTLQKLGLSTDDAVLLKFGPMGEGKPLSDISGGGGVVKPLSSLSFSDPSSSSGDESGPLSDLGGVGGADEESSETAPDSESGESQPDQNPSTLNVDPSALGEGKVDPDGSVHYKGLTVLPNNFVQVHAGNTDVLYDAEGKKVSVSKASDKIIFGKDGLPYTQQNGTLVRVPMEGDDEDTQLGTGEDAVKGLSQGDAEIVKKLSSYDLPLSALGRGGLSNPYNRKLIRRASLYNPAFDFTDYQAKQRVKLDYTSGKSFAQVKSLNNAIGHIHDLFEGISLLGNGNFQGYNFMKNFIKEQGGSSALEKFNTAAQGVAAEVPTVIKGTSATIPEIEAWQNRLSSSKSPEQLKAVVNEMLSLLSTRVHDLNDRYEENLHSPIPYKLLDDNSVKLLNSMGRRDISAAVSESETPAAPIGSPSTGSADQEVLKNFNSYPEETQKRILDKWKREGKDDLIQQASPSGPPVG